MRRKIAFAASGANIPMDTEGEGACWTRQFRVPSSAQIERTPAPCGLQQPETARMDVMNLSKSSINRRGQAPLGMASAAALALAVAASTASADAPRWEQVPTGTTYTCGDTAYVNAVLVKFYPLLECPTGQTFCNNAQVVMGGLPCNYGHRLNLNNIQAQFDFAASSGVENGLLMRFGQYGGFMNISINRSPTYCFTQMGDLDGVTIAGVTMSVTNGFGNGCGTIEFTGAVSQVRIGGQEFWVDGICEPQPRDINGDGLVNAADLALLLNAWGTNVEYADFNCDEKVDGVDLAELLNSWS
jgi:hypothetical protein